MYDRNLKPNFFTDITKAASVYNGKISAISNKNYGEPATPKLLFQMGLKKI
jgi:hypothetical protein